MGGEQRSRAAWFATTVALLAALACAAAAFTMFRAMQHMHAAAELSHVVPLGSPTRLPEGWDEADHRILILGDSRVAQWNPLPALPGTAFGISGIGGETSRELRLRVEAGRDIPPADIAIIMTGANDMMAAHLNPGIAKRIESALVGNAIATAAALREGGARPVIAAIGQPATPDWRRRLAGYSGAINAEVYRVNQRLREAAQAGGFDWFDTNAPLGAKGEQPLSGSEARDMLHWNATAYERVNRALVERFGG